MTSSAAGTARVGQPFQHLRGRWDVRVHEPPIVPNQAVRPDSLVIWQRPLPPQEEPWLQALRMIRSRGSLLVVEWDDHPDLFPPHIRQQLEQTNCCHLRMAHALQVSCPRLAAALRRYHPLALVVENGVDPIPALNLDKHRRPDPLRVFIGNLNREDEHRQLQPALEAWLHENPRCSWYAPDPVGSTSRGQRTAGATPASALQHLSKTTAVATSHCCPCRSVRRKPARPRSNGWKPQQRAPWSSADRSSTDHGCKTTATAFGRLMAPR